MLSPTSRVLLRQTHIFSRLSLKRKASTTSEVAESAKAKSSQAVSQASQGLSRVTATASSTLSSAGDAAGKAASRLGGRASRMVAFVQTNIPRVVYISRVGLELGKIIVEGRQMQPPSMAVIQSSMQQLRHAMRNPQTLLKTTSSLGLLEPSKVMNRMRNLDRRQMLNIGVVTAELLGFYTIGQMIGRLKIVGYHSDKSLEGAGGHH